DSAQGDSALRPIVGLRRGSRHRTGELHTGILRYGVGDSANYQRQCAVVISAAHLRNGFSLEAANLAVGQYRFQSVTNFDSGATILYCVQDQDALVGLLAANSPLLEEV